MSCDTPITRLRWERRHALLLPRLEAILDAGHLIGRKVVLIDPEDNGYHRNEYEDLDQETPQDVREVLVTLYPERSKAAAAGDSQGGLVVVTHAEACADIRRMIDRFGYRIAHIGRDLD